MSKIELIYGSCADQVADVVVNAANDGLWAGGGICGVIFRKAGMQELTEKRESAKNSEMDLELISLFVSICVFKNSKITYRRERDLNIGERKSCHRYSDNFFKWFMIYFN